MYCTFRNSYDSRGAGTWICPRVNAGLMRSAMSRAEELSSSGASFSCWRRFTEYMDSVNILAKEGEDVESDLSSFKI